MFAVKKLFADRPVHPGDLFVSTLYAPPENWIEALSMVLDRVKHPEIKSIEALLMQMLDRDAIAVLMMKHLLYWWSRSIRRDGAIWRNAADWEAYVGVTSSQVYDGERRERLKHNGVQVWNAIAQGIKQMHFKLDAVYFTARAAKVLGIRAGVIHEMVWCKQFQSGHDEVGSGDSETGSGNGKVGSGNPQNPITNESTLLSTGNTNKLVRAISILGNVDDMLSALASGGLLSEVDRLALKGLEREQVLDCLSSFEVATNVRHPRNYLTSALKSKVVSYPSLTPSPSSYLNSERVTAPLRNDPDWWACSRNQLELQLDRQTWFFVDRLRLIELEEGVVRLSMPDGVAEWIYLRLKRNIERAISDVLGDKTSVEFVGAMG